MSLPNNGTITAAVLLLLTLIFLGCVCVKALSLASNSPALVDVESFSCPHRHRRRKQRRAKRARRRSVSPSCDSHELKPAFNQGGRVAAYSQTSDKAEGRLSNSVVVSNPILPKPEEQRIAVVKQEPFYQTQ